MNSKITTAVIPVAGFGTRMLPASKAIPKEMLPVVDQPLIQYIVEECVAAGIEQIVLVTHSSKATIENHFDTNFELETSLESKNKTALLKVVQETIPDHVSITAVRQSEAKGLGHAVLCAHPVIGDNPVAVLLPDVLIDNMQSDLAKDNLAKMLSDFAENEQSQIMVEPVPMEKVSSYGVVDINGVTVKEGEYAPMTAVVEKPPVEEAPSNLSVVGRYVLSAQIWDHLRNTPRGAGNEIQLTDAIAMLMDSETVNACHITGKSHDCGSKEGYMKANLVYGFRHPDIGASLKAAAKELL